MRARPGRLLASLLAVLAGATPGAAGEPARLRVAVRYPASLEAGPLDGRLLLLLSTDPSAEPRFQVRDTSAAKSQHVFGIDVEGWRPGEDAVLRRGGRLRADVRAEDGRADGEDGAAGRRPHELAALRSSSRGRFPATGQSSFSSFIKAPRRACASASRRARTGATAVRSRASPTSSR